MDSSYMWYRLELSYFLWWGYCTSESIETARLAFSRKEKSSSNSEESDRGECVGCFSSSEFGGIYCGRRNLNAYLLWKIYKQCLLPTARNQFEQKSNEWTLQEDNDPKHMSKLAQEWRLKHEAHRIQWPSMSPESNPIEKVWKLLKMTLSCIYDQSVTCTFITYENIRLLMLFERDHRDRKLLWSSVI